MAIEIPDSSALPISRRKRRKRASKLAMTEEERNAVQFAAIKAEFDWSNDEWAATWLPWVRVAAVHVAGDQDQLMAFMRNVVSTGEAPNILEGLTRTKMHLEVLEKLIEAALTRSFLMLERLGYSPENPPPDSRPN